MRRRFDGHIAGGQGRHFAIGGYGGHGRIRTAPGNARIVRRRRIYIRRDGRRVARVEDGGIRDFDVSHGTDHPDRTGRFVAAAVVRAGRNGGGAL